MKRRYGSYLRIEKQKTALDKDYVYICLEDAVNFFKHDAFSQDSSNKFYFRIRGSFQVLTDLYFILFYHLRWSSKMVRSWTQDKSQSKSV